MKEKFETLQDLLLYYRNRTIRNKSCETFKMITKFLNIDKNKIDHYHIDKNCRILIYYI